MSELQRLRDASQQAAMERSQASAEQVALALSAAQQASREHEEHAKLALAEKSIAEQQLQSMQSQLQQLQAHLREQQRSSEQRDRQHQALQAQIRIASAGDAAEQLQQLEGARLRQLAEHDAELSRLKEAAAAAAVEAEETLRRERDLHQTAMQSAQQQSATAVAQSEPAKRASTPTHITQLRQTLQLRAAKPYAPYADQFPFLRSRYQHDPHTLDMYSHQTETLLRDWQGNESELQEMESYIHAQQLQPEKQQLADELAEYVKRYHRADDSAIRAQLDANLRSRLPPPPAQSPQNSTAPTVNAAPAPDTRVLSVSTGLPVASSVAPPPRPLGKPSMDLGSPVSQNKASHLRSASKPLPSVPATSPLSQPVSIDSATPSTDATIDERQKKMLNRSLSKPLPTPVSLGVSSAMTQMVALNAADAPVQIDAATSPLTAVTTDTQTSTDAPGQATQSTQSDQQLVVGQSVQALLAEGFTPKPDAAAQLRSQPAALVTPTKSLAAASAASPLPAFVSNPLQTLPTQVSSNDDEFGIDYEDLIPSQPADLTTNMPHDTHQTNNSEGNNAADEQQRTASETPSIAVFEPVASEAVPPASADVVCELCEMHSAVLRCESCDQNLCVEGGCDADLHQPLRMQTHQRVPIQHQQQSEVEAQAARQIDDMATAPSLHAASSTPASMSSVTQPSTLSNPPLSTGSVASKTAMLLALGFTPKSAEEQLKASQSSAPVVSPAKVAVPTVLPQLPEKKPIITAGRRAATAGSAKPVFKLDYSLAG